MVRVKDMRVLHRQRSGFSLFELVFSSALALMIFGAVVLSITGSAYSQTRAEILFAADVVLTARSEVAAHLPYDELNTLVGQETLEQNGYSFTLTTAVDDVSGVSPSGLREVSFQLSWKDRISEGSRERSVLRSAPW